MNDSTVALFNQYETEYCNKSTEISRKINATASLSGDLRKRKITEVETDIREADNVIKRMDMEARSLSPEKSRQLLLKVKDYKADLANLREQLKQASGSTSAGDAARAELGLGNDYYSTSAGQRERMLGASQRLEKTSERLALGKQQLLEAEDMGANILKDLHGQREVIVGARDTLHGADDNISKARRILTTMAKRIWTNKLIMIGISVFLLVAIIIVIWVKVKK